MPARFGCTDMGMGMAAATDETSVIDFDGTVSFFFRRFTAAGTSPGPASLLTALVAKLVVSSNGLAALERAGLGRNGPGRVLCTGTFPVEGADEVDAAAGGGVFLRRRVLRGRDGSCGNWYPVDV